MMSAGIGPSMQEDLPVALTALRSAPQQQYQISGDSAAVSRIPQMTRANLPSLMNGCSNSMKCPEAGDHRRPLTMRSNELPPKRNAFVDRAVLMITSDRTEAMQLLETWIDMGYLEGIVKSAVGSAFLQQALPPISETLRAKIYATAFSRDVFYNVCDDVHGSHFMQKLVEHSRAEEVCRLVSLVRGCLVDLICGYYSTHTMQKLWDRMDEIVRLHLLGELRGKEADVAINRCGTHLIVKVIESMPVFGYGPIIDSLSSHSVVMRTVAENPYGSRVIQVAVNKLQIESRCDVTAQMLFKKLIGALVQDCEHLTSHRYANYIIQQIISSPVLDLQTNAIISALLGKLLLLAQEKYASHVLQRALNFCSAEMLSCMMEEILNGYECDSEGWDAVGLMMMDHFGNYVVQTMLDVAIDVRTGRRIGNLAWYEQLADCIIARREQLEKQSSGRRILKQLHLQGQKWTEKQMNNNNIVEKLTALNDLPAVA